MMKCEIIQDLLPSYLDHTCSEETRILVEEHLSTCESCRQLMKELSNDSFELPNIDEEKVFKKVKYNYYKKIFVVFVLLLMVFVGAGSEISSFVIKGKMNLYMLLHPQWAHHDFEMIELNYYDHNFDGNGVGISYGAVYKGNGVDERIVVSTEGFWLKIDDSYDYHIKRKYRTAERLGAYYQRDVIDVLRKYVPEYINGYETPYNVNQNISYMNVYAGLIPDEILNQYNEYMIDTWEYLELNMDYSRSLDEKYPFSISIILELNEEEFNSKEIVRTIVGILKENNFKPKIIEFDLRCNDLSEEITVENLELK